MSKFNTASENSMKTVNKENHVAYRMDWKTKLITMVLTSFFNEEKFYGDNSEELTNVLVSGINDDPEFVMRLAIFARREFNMRSVSHVIAAYLAHENNGKPYAKMTIERIILRGDDATEILSCYLSIFGKPIPNSLRKALKAVFPTFDAYTLAKYKGEGKSVKMRDILCLCRPTPTSEEQSKVWKDLLEGNIAPAYTWETELSAKGNNKETWEELIDSGKVGYMALLRNLRNIINAEPGNIQKVFDKISDKEAVLHSKQLPFRYLSAYRNLPADKWDSGKARSALETAAEIAVENMPKIPGKTIIAIDTSGSMRQTISSKSDIRCADISMLLGLMANRICEEAMVWSFDSQLYKIDVDKADNILRTAANAKCPGGSTNMYLPLNYMIEKGIKADRIIYLSDNECNYNFDSSWAGFRYNHGRQTVQSLADDYRKKINPNLWVHAIDLCGYGTQQFIGGRTNVLGGWSEKVFEFISLAEQGTDSLIKRIQNYGKSEE